MGGELSLLHLAAELNLIKHIEVLLAFDLDVNIKSEVSVFISHYLSCKSHERQSIFLSHHTLNIRMTKRHFTMHV